MKIEKAVINLDTIKQKTVANSKRIAMYLKTANKLTLDVRRSERLTESLCESCFYIVGKDRIGGRAITYRDCGICTKEMVFSSTCTDVLCIDCAKKRKLCKRCGGGNSCR